MKFVWKKDGAIGTLKIFAGVLSKTDAEEMLSRVTEDRSLKGIVVAAVLPESKIEEPLPEGITAALSDAGVPIAAVFDDAVPSSFVSLRDASHFQFRDIEAAGAHLAALTHGRSSRIVRAVIAAVDAGKTRGLEDALIEETRRFTELARAKMRISEDPQT